MGHLNELETVFSSYVQFQEREDQTIQAFHTRTQIKHDDVVSLWFLKTCLILTFGRCCTRDTHLVLFCFVFIHVRSILMFDLGSIRAQWLKPSDPLKQSLRENKRNMSKMICRARNICIENNKSISAAGFEGKSWLEKQSVFMWFLQTCGV